MNPLSEWAHRHNINPEAIADLRLVLDSGLPHQRSAPGSSEASAQQAIRLEAPRHGVRLWRNNVGACVDERGNQVRYGLANESRAMNRAMKSHDLIGITPVTIAGQTVGVFTSIECKRPGWKYSGNAHESAQHSWGQLVIGLGGIAKFATTPQDIWS